MGAFVGVTPYTPAHGVVYRGVNPVAIVQVLEWRIAGAIRVVKIVRGPLFLEGVSHGEKVSSLWLIRSRYALSRLDLLLWAPELEEGPEAEILLREMGMRRIITGYSSVWLDLTQDEATLRAGLHQKWRNQLVRGEAPGLALRAGDFTGGAKQAIDPRLHRVGRQRAGRRDPGVPTWPNGDLLRRLERTGGAPVPCQ
jgi:hypothetical protein